MNEQIKSNNPGNEESGNSNEGASYLIILLYITNLRINAKHGTAQLFTLTTTAIYGLLVNRYGSLIAGDLHAKFNIIVLKRNTVALFPKYTS